MAITRALARRVRALRQARGWSLDELAYRSKVSKGMVVQIEGARTNPSIGTLCRLSDAFGLSIAQLVEAEEPMPVRIIGVDEPPTLWTGDRGGSARLLCGVSEPATVELWDWRFEPGEQHTSVDHATGTRELVHVLDGEVEVIVDGTGYTARAGESVDFRADRPHAYTNPGDRAARLTIVVVMPR